MAFLVFTQLTFLPSVLNAATVAALQQIRGRRPYSSQLALTSDTAAHPNAPDSPSGGSLCLPVINCTWTPQTNGRLTSEAKNNLSSCKVLYIQLSLPHVSASVHVRKPPFGLRFRLRSPRSASDTRIRNGTDFIRPRPPQKPRSWSCLYSNVVHHHVIYISANTLKQSNRSTKTTKPVTLVGTRRHRSRRPRSHHPPPPCRILR